MGNAPLLQEIPKGILVLWILMVTFMVFLGVIALSEFIGDLPAFLDAIMNMVSQAIAWLRDLFN